MKSWISTKLGSNEDEWTFVPTNQEELEDLQAFLKRQHDKILLPTDTKPRRVV